MKIAEAKQVHGLIVEEKWCEAANLVLTLSGSQPTIKRKPDAIVVLQGLVQYLLDNDDYLCAATLEWGPDVFNTEPESVRRSFDAVGKCSKLLIMGGSSLGKTYGVGAWMLLDWLRDPFYTAVKLTAVSEKHLRENLFPHVVRMMKNLAVPPPVTISVKDSDLWMGVKEAGYEFGISGIAFKQSQDTSGQLKGHKFVPVRKKAHPKFGYLSRLRVLMDEGQNVPGGPFQDFNSLSASIDGIEHIKIVVAFNPEFLTCQVVGLAEPPEGWEIEQLDTLYDYDSRAGWRVCRLDAARCENVIQRQLIHKGLQTYKGYTDYLKSGGDNSPAYLCFARGFPPMVGTFNCVIPPSWPNAVRGEAIFIETPKVLSAVDIAFQGGDSAQMSIARWGLASGWKNHKGEFTKFKNRLDVSRDKPRHVLQIDQIMQLERHDDTIKMAEEIMGRCKVMQIPPENVATDKSGVGFGTHSHLVKVWGNVFGIGWSEGATSTKILADDTGPADEQCEGIMSEMWWTFRRWMDPTCCAILINPIIPTSPIYQQLTARRFSTVKAGKIKVESKDAYKARNGGKSPDEVDSLIMLPQLVRHISDILPGLVEQESRSQAPDGAPIKYEQATKIVSIEEFDGIELKDEDKAGQSGPGEYLYQE